jgi:hypothetical protein
MPPVPSTSRGGRLCAAWAAALIGCAVLAGPARAAEAPDTSLKLVPADAAFYTAMLRNKEQVDLVAKSEAWAKLWSLPAVQQWWKNYHEMFNQSWSQFLSDNDNKDLVALLQDAASDEVFCYGDDSWVGFMQLYGEVYGAMQYGPAAAQIEGNPGGRSQEELQGRAVLSALAKHPELIKVPNFVVGFKVSDEKRAEKQIQRLEDLAKKAAEQSPDLKGRVKRTKVGDASFLTLTLEGSQVPWDQVPIKRLEYDPGEFGPVMDKLKGLTLTVSLGVEHGYLLLGVGPSTDELTRFAGKGPHLDGQAAFKPLGKFSDKKLTSIGYTSKAFLQAAAGYNLRQLDAAVELAKAGLAKADLTDAQRKALLKQLEDLNAGLQGAENRDVGPAMSFTYLTDRGYEGYSYSYGQHPGVEGSKPLTLLDHVGGNPLFAVVGRGTVNPEDYEKFAKKVEDAFPQLDEIAESKLKGQDKERYEKAKKDFIPLLKRLNETTAKLLLPALADGQGGFVFDAKWKSKHWQKEMPETEKAMPMPEIALLFGVSDADKLRKAMVNYRDILNEAIAKAKTWPGGEKIGDFQIPEPKEDASKAGEFYSYPPPANWGLDLQVVFTAGIRDKVAVLALSHALAERLLAPDPLKVDGGPLAAKDRPMAAAVICNWAGFVDAARPWVDYGVDKALEAQGGVKPAAGDRETIFSQVHTVLDVLKCFRGMTSATTVEDGVLVTHSEAVFHDLPK